MKNSEVLEQYQEECFKDELAKYSFEVSASGATSNEEAILNSKAQGITLHFLRYGLFDKNPYYKHANTPITAPYFKYEEEEEPQIEEVIHEIKLNICEITSKRIYPKPERGMPKFKKVNFERTVLNKGYLYIINETKDFFFQEFKIDEFGGFSAVKLKNNLDFNGGYKDIREKTESKTVYSFNFDKESVIWAAYSPVQWSLQQIEDAKADPDAFKMRKVICSGFQKEEERTKNIEKHIHPYNEFMTCFKSDQEVERVQFEERLKTIATIEQADDPNNENTLLEDMFVTLDDPIGCANDLCLYNEIEQQWHQAILNSLTKPGSFYYHFDKLMGLKPKEPKLPNKKEQEQLEYIFTTALSVYKFIYDNPELEEKHSRKVKDWTEGVDEYKIKHILGVKYRNNIKKEINDFRDDLGNFLLSDYYQNSVDTFLNNHYAHLEEGKDITAYHLLVLVQYPGFRDRHLSLSKDYSPQKDTWIKKLKGSLSTNSKVFKKVTELLDVQIPIEALINEQGEPVKNIIALTETSNGAVGKIASAYASIGAVEKSLYDKINRKIRYTSITQNGKKGPFYKLRNSDFKSMLNDPEFKKLYNPNKSHQTKTYTYLKVHSEKLEEAKTIAKTSAKNSPTNIYVEVVDRKRFGKYVDGILKSKGYNRFVLGFEIWSLGCATHDLYKNGFNAKDTANFGVAIVKTTSALLNLHKTVQAIKGVPIVAGSKLSNRILFIGAAGSFLGVVMAGRDTYSLINSNDYDAAGSMAVVGVCSGVFLAAELGLIALSLGPTIILAAIGLIAFGLYMYFKDSPLEAYFKRFPLSTNLNVIEQYQNMTPYAYAQLLYAKKDKLLREEPDSDLRLRKPGEHTDFKTVFVDFMNIVAGGSLKLSGSHRSISRYDTGHYLEAMPDKNKKDEWYKPWKAVGADITFGNFLRSTDQLDYEVYCYGFTLPLSGEIIGKRFSIKIPKNHIRIFTSVEDGLFVAQVWVNMPEYINYESTSKETRSAPYASVKSIKKLYLDDSYNIAILGRITYQQDMFFPLTDDNKPGYLAAGIPVGYRNYNTKRINRPTKTTVIDKSRFLKLYPQLKNNLNLLIYM